MSGSHPSGSQWSRRMLLAQGAAALAAAATPPIMSHAAQKESAIDLSRDCIDAHSHVWTDDVARYPLAQGFSKADMQPPSFTPHELLAQARPCGVSRVVLI